MEGLKIQLFIHKGVEYDKQGVETPISTLGTKQSNVGFKFVIPADWWLVMNEGTGPRWASLGTNLPDSVDDRQFVILVDWWLKARCWNPGQHLLGPTSQMLVGQLEHALSGPWVIMLAKSKEGVIVIVIVIVFVIVVWQTSLSLLVSVGMGACKVLYILPFGAKKYHTI